LMETLEARKLPQPKSFGDSELDLFYAMMDGLTPVDVAFCERIKLIELTDGLLSLLGQPLPGHGDFNQTRISMMACKLFVLRGHLLCQQGKTAEGQPWLLKPRLMARRTGSDQSLLQLLTAIAMDGIGQQSAARYAETWAESDRQAYVKSAEALAALGELHTAIRSDNDTYPEKHRMRTMIKEFKSMTPTQQRERLNEILDGAFPGPEYQKEQSDFVNMQLDIITNLTPETYDALVKGISSELDPLTPEKIKAFTSRNDEAIKQVQSVYWLATRWLSLGISTQKAATLYRAMTTPGIAGIARQRLDLDLKAKLLVVAMQKGSSFDEKCLANLTTAEGKALRLGTHEGCKAILTADGQPFLTIGRVK
ncbi:MAG: hypothetical protein ORN27_10640, partial [Rhodoluna sp.]|nr:hypothetical protein [Rhodoluna sp.]